MSEDLLRDRAIDALLPQVPFDGWTMKALRQALAAIGEHPDDAALLFLGGAGEMIEAFCALTDERMAAAAAAAGLQAYRVPARVRAVIAIRLEQNREHKEAIRRALGWLAIPVNASRSVRITAATVNSIWHAAGDGSADFSWYTKRGILAGVYGATLLYWLRDISEDDAAALAFLDRRLAGVAAIGGLRKRLASRIGGARDWARGFAPNR